MMRRAVGPVLALVAALPAVAGEPLTLERIHSPEVERAFAVPRVAWTAGGDLLMYDERRPEAERTLERVDPETGERRPVVDAAAALSWFGEALGDDPPDELGWPAALDAAARRAVWVRKDDLFLLDLTSSGFVRLTRTEAEESAPRFSPDGSRLAFVRDNDLWVRDLACGREQRLTTDGSPTLLNGTLSWVYFEEIRHRRDEAFWWSPSGDRLAFLQSDDAGVDELVLPGFAGPDPAVKRQRYPHPGHANPRVRLGLVPAAGGQVRWVALGEPEYIVQVAWRDAVTVAVQTLDRRQLRLELHLVDAATGAARTVLTETSPTPIEVHDDLRFLAGGRFLWSSERDGARRLELFRADGTRERVLTPGHLHLVDAALGEERGSVRGVDEAAGVVWVTATTGPVLAPGLYRVRLDGSGAEPVAVGGTHRVAMAPSGDRFLDRRADLRTPPALELRSSDGALVSVLAPAPLDTVRELGLELPELVLLPVADGGTVAARVLRPAGEGARPVVVYVYGGPAAPVVTDDWPRRLLWENLLLDNGFAVAAVDPRSASGRDARSRQEAFGRIMGEPELADVRLFADWLGRQPWADRTRLGVWGWSGGGAFTLQLMSRLDVFRAGAAVASVADWRLYDSFWTEHRLGLPDENREGYEASSALPAAGGVRGRLLLVHGTGDDNVHPHNTLGFAEALQAADVDFEMMLYPGQKHGIRDHRKHVERTILEFFRRHLEPDTPDMAAGDAAAG